MSEKVDHGILRQLTRRVKRFTKADSGNVALMVTIALPVLILSVGGGADYMRLLAARSKLQAAADSATLATYKHYSLHKDATLGSLKSYFHNQLKASLQSRFEQDITVDPANITLTLDDEQGGLASRVIGTFPTTFIRLAGINTVNLDVEAEVQAKVTYTEVALVLDTTGSMRGSKIAELKAAATNFLNKIYSALPSGGSDTFKVAIVPFAQYVNVGKENRYAPWIHVEPDRTFTIPRSKKVCRRWECLETAEQEREVCHWEGDPDGDRHKVCRTETRRVCVKSRWVPITPCETRRWTVEREVYWEGCVGSREHPLNLTDEDYITPVPGVMNRPRNADAAPDEVEGWIWHGRANKCPVPLTPLLSLQDNKDELIDKINNLRANGFTYIPSGLVWGWRVLSAKEPFTGGATDDEVSKKDIRKIIILMTDGANTRAPDRRDGRLYQDHQQADRAYADEMVRQLCSNIKQKNPATGKPNAEIITITFDVTDPGIKSLMKECSSMGSYDAASGELNSVFDSIASKVMALHLSK